MREQKLLTAKPSVSGSKSESVSIAEVYQESALRKIEEYRRRWERMLNEAISGNRK